MGQVLVLVLVLVLVPERRPLEGLGVPLQLD
jgi:hypothetical protein